MSWFDTLFGGGTSGTAPSTVDGAKARELVKQGAQLVDVRSAGEYAGGHVAGAKNIPVDQLARRLGELDKGKPVVLYCQSGGRSRSAGNLLLAQGFAAVYDLGPMRAW